jgi:hypothetical protein
MPIDQRYIGDAIAIAAALLRQVEIWQRQPATTREEMNARHERVRAFMKLVQVEADSLRPGGGV